jgi:uncharacterized protein
LVLIAILYFLSARWLDRRPWRDYGLHFGRNWWIDFGFGLFLGALLMGLVFLTQLLLGWIEIRGYFEAQQMPGGFIIGFIAFILIYLFVGIYEEMQFRGYQLRNLAEGLNLKAIDPRAAVALAWIGTSIWFGLAHAINPNASLVSTLNLMLAGCSWAWGIF